MQNQILRVLSTEELSRIHDVSLGVLERVGMKIEHKGAQEILDGAGAIVESSTGVVRFPPTLVEEKLKLVPRSFEYHGRSPDVDVRLEPGGEVYSRIAGGAPEYIELASGRHRPARIGDLREFAVLGDALSEIHIASVLTCEDVPLETSELHAVKVLLEHQRKCIATNALTIDNLRTMIEMLVAVQGSREALVSRPLVHLLLCPVSPLTLLEDMTEQLLFCCEYGIPTDNPIMPAAGSSSPNTLAGTIVQANAEFLGTMTLAQTARPGHPMPYFADPVVADIRTISAQFATPEVGLLIASLQQLGGGLYGFPPQGIGLDSDGFDYAQTLFQKAQNTIFQVMSGGKLVIGAGNVEGCMAFDPAQLVIDNELMRIARRWARGVTVNDDTMALEVIERVGQVGQFLDDDHTIKHLRSGELLDTELFARSNRETWVAAGSKDLVVRAREKALSILKTHEVEPLPEHVSRELNRIMAKADESVGKG
ncbi:MAG: trimethylamine methyltransferase family protein [Spirochaetota bacterium]|nr:MAG: trimethylamine methyltransferase family protein [Spirochaetota bacterium]